MVPLNLNVARNTVDRTAAQSVVRAQPQPRVMKDLILNPQVKAQTSELSNFHVTRDAPKDK